MKIDLQEIQRLVQKYQPELLEFCQKLVRIHSVNGVDVEGKVAQLIVDQAKNLDLPVEMVGCDRDRFNVFVGTGFTKKSGLLLIAHLDTVGEGDRSEWRFDPFGGQIEDGKLFGRGALDAKSSLALCLYALKILKDLGKLDMAKFAAVVDEESGADSKLGANFLLDKGLLAGAAIYTEPGVEKVAIGHRGLVRLWVKAKGQSVHSGSILWQEKKKGANAIDGLIKFLTRLEEIKMEGVHPDFPGYHFTLTPTLIEGGESESIVPGEAKVLLDARLLPNQGNDEFIKKVEKLVKSLEDDKIRFEIEVKNNIPGAVISKEEPIVKILEKLDKEVMGVKPLVYGVGPANEGYMFIQAGIPTICGFGPVGGGSHATDEYVEIESLPKLLEIYIRAALELPKL